MASLFAELYADFIDSAKVYQEKLDVTPISFMRRYTRAIQQFQRDTEYVEAIVDIAKAATPPYFILPRTAIRVLEVRDMNSRPILLNSYLQISRNLEIQGNRTYETPIDYDTRLQQYTQATALGTVYNREINFQDAANHSTIRVYYVPDLPAFTAPEAVPDLNDIWAAWFPIETNFEAMFTTRRLHPAIAPFEEAFLDKALALYIRSLGNANYRVYEEAYKEEVQNAIILKPTYFKEAVADYFIAPYS
jgi:hypothetical protein